MITFWYVIMMIILVMITVLLPFAQFMYETDEDDTVVKNHFCFISIIQELSAIVTARSMWICFFHFNIIFLRFSNAFFLGMKMMISLFNKKFFSFLYHLSGIQIMHSTRIHYWYCCSSSACIDDLLDFLQICRYSNLSSHQCMNKNMLIFIYPLFTLYPNNHYSHAFP